MWLWNPSHMWYVINLFVSKFSRYTQNNPLNSSIQVINSNEYHNGQSLEIITNLV